MEISEAKNLLPLPALLNQLGFSTPNKSKCVIKCPLHHEQNGESFSMEYKDGSWVWKCFGKCARGGDEITLIEVLESKSRCAAIQRYIELAGGGNGQVTARRRVESAPLSPTKLVPAPPPLLQKQPTTFDWDKDVSPLKSDRFAIERGYSAEFVAELQEEKLIGTFKKRICLPVYLNCRIIGVHQKVGDHWEYFPKGIKTAPLVIGRLFTDEVIDVFESQWDAFALHGEDL